MPLYPVGLLQLGDTVCRLPSKIQIIYACQGNVIKLNRSECHASSKNNETGMATYSRPTDSLSLDSSIALCRVFSKLISPSKSLADMRF